MIDHSDLVRGRMCFGKYSNCSLYYWYPCFVLSSSTSSHAMHINLSYYVFRVKGEYGVGLKWDVEQNFWTFTFIPSENVRMHFLCLSCISPSFHHCKPQKGECIFHGSIVRTKTLPLFCSTYNTSLKLKYKCCLSCTVSTYGQEK